MEPTQIIPPSSTPQAAPTKPSSSMGIVIGLVVIVAAVTVGAFYFWNDRMHEQAVEDKMSRDLAKQSASTEAAAIEADLSSATPDDFDAELDSAMAEMDAAFDVQ